MADSEAEGFAHDADAARAVVLVGFGETITQFQLVELSFWAILATRLKRGVTLDHGMNKVAGWDAQTMGRLVGVLGVPDELKNEADQAVRARNYLAHAFMRDRAPYMYDAAFCEHVVQELVEVQARLDVFEEHLDAYIRDLGVDDLTDEDLAQLGLDEPPDPTDWFRQVNRP